MSRLLLLDTGPLGLAVKPRGDAEFDTWFRAIRSDGFEVCIPEIAVYELRRELLRIRSVDSLAILAEYVQTLTYLPITTPIILRATELWAEVRQRGRPTAGAEALDGDVILAATAQLLTEGGNDVLIATTNATHLSLFAAAALWRDIRPLPRP